MQNATARLISGASRYDHISTKAKNCSQVCFRGKFKELILTYKALNGLRPQYFVRAPPLKIFSQTTQPSQASLWLVATPREGQEMTFPSFGRELGTGPFRWWATTLWNLLPADVLQAPSHLFFRIRKHLTMELLKEEHPYVRDFLFHRI